MSVVVRTHGGLGNQLFQILYARLFASARSAPLFETHDIRYKHAFPRSSELVVAPRPSAIPATLSALRLPKVFTSLKMHCNAVSVLGVTCLDGYFQNTADFAEFDSMAIRQHLIEIRDELGIATVPVRDHGVHLRLGDFFKSEAAVSAHLSSRIAHIGNGAGIVTNEEARLATPEVTAVIAAAGAYIVPTSDMSAEAVLRTLASFHRVDGNDSTLLFWASVLSGMDCDFKTPELRELRGRFFQILGY